MFTTENKKQPPEIFYKKAVLKIIPIISRKYLCFSLFLIKLGLQICNFIKKRFQHRCFSLNIFGNKLFKEDCYKKKSIALRNLNQISITNLIMRLLPRQDFCISAQVLVARGYIQFYQSKKITKSTNNTLTIGLSQLVTCQNCDADISPLILMTDLIDIYTLLSENVSFLECF